MASNATLTETAGQIYRACEWNSGNKISHSAKYIAEDQPLPAGKFCYQGFKIAK